MSEVATTFSDYRLPKPQAVRGYELHRMVAALDARAPFADCGDYVLIRSGRSLEGLAASPVREVSRGDVVGFELRACTGYKVKGHHRYWPSRDWRSRHEWLKTQGVRYGFEIVAVHCSAEVLVVEKRQPFTVDDTRFVGVLRVTDVERFSVAVARGIGKCRTFGFGMLIL